MTAKANRAKSDRITRQIEILDRRQTDLDRRLSNLEAFILFELGYQPKWRKWARTPFGGYDAGK